jgi:DNA repair protein RadA/Sms
VAEPGLDLPLALALASSLRDRAIAPGTVVIGEVGLLGELRPVSGLERRLREAARLGFVAAIVPPPGRGGMTPRVEGLRVTEVATLRDAVQVSVAGVPSARGDAMPAMLG